MSRQGLTYVGNPLSDLIDAEPIDILEFELEGLKDLASPFLTNFEGRLLTFFLSPSNR